MTHYHLTLVGRAQLPAAFAAKLDRFQYTGWTLFGLHLALHEPPKFAAAKFDPNINRTLKWSIGAETMDAEVMVTYPTDAFLSKEYLEAEKKLEDQAEDTEVRDPAHPIKRDFYLNEVLGVTIDYAEQLGRQKVATK